MEILNLNEIDKIFDGLFLTDKEGNSLKRAMLRDSLTPIVKDARMNLSSSVNEKTGNLKRSLGVIATVRKDTAYAATGASTKGKKKGNHFHFINSGTTTRTTNSGQNRGAVTATGFFDKAVLSNLSGIPDVMQESFNKRLEKFIKTKY